MRFVDRIRRDAAGFAFLVLLATSVASALELGRCARLELLMTTQYSSSVFPSPLQDDLGESIARKLLIMHADLQARAVREDYFHLGSGRGSAYDAELPERHHTTLTDYVRGERALLMRRSTREHAFAPATCIVVPADDTWRDPGEWIDMLRFKGHGAIHTEDLVPGLAAVEVSKHVGTGNNSSSLVRVETWLLPAVRQRSIASIIAGQEDEDDGASNKRERGLLLHLGIDRAASDSDSDSDRETGSSRGSGGSKQQATADAQHPPQRPALQELLRRLIRVDAPSRGSNYTVLSASLLPACPGSATPLQRSASTAHAAGVDTNADSATASEEQELSWLFEPEDDLFTLGHQQQHDDDERLPDMRIRCAAAVGASSTLASMLDS